MGYRLLGYVIWRAGKWYARRRFPGARRKAAIAGVSAAVLGGAIVAGRAAVIVRRLTGAPERGVTSRSPMTESQTPPVEVRTADCERLDGELLSLQLTGTWADGAASAEQLMLIVDADGHRHRFPAVPRPRPASGPSAPQFEARFTVPASLERELDGGVTLLIGEIAVDVPAIAAPDPEPAEPAGPEPEPPEPGASRPPARSPPPRRRGIPRRRARPTCSRRCGRNWPNAPGSRRGCAPNSPPCRLASTRAVPPRSAWRRSAAS